MENNSNEQEKHFPVREGTAESSILHDKKPPEKTFPEPEIKIQEKNQPEYSEEQPNRNSPSTPGNSQQQ